MKERVELKEIRRKARELQLTVKTKTLSWGVHATVCDTLSDWSTAGSVFNGKDPNAVDFLSRLEELTSHIDGNEVYRQGEYVYGLK